MELLTKKEAAEIEADPVGTMMQYIRDAKRYRELRECSPWSSAHGAVSINWPIYDNGKLVKGRNAVSHEELDKLLDERVIRHFLYQLKLEKDSDKP